MKYTLFALGSAEGPSDGSGVRLIRLDGGWQPFLVAGGSCTKAPYAEKHMLRTRAAKKEHYPLERERVSCPFGERRRGSGTSGIYEPESSFSRD